MGGRSVFGIITLASNIVIPLSADNTLLNLHNTTNLCRFAVSTVFYHACEMKIKIHPYGHLMSFLLFLSYFYSSRGTWREGLIYINEENWDVIYSELIKHKINSKFHLELSINSSILVKENMSLSVPSFSPTGLPVFLR